MDQYDALKLDNQMCFPLYAASREVIKQYKPYLDVLDLTYTQYLAMMVLWESDQISVKEMGCRLYLDSGTLTPVLKSLESKGYVCRSRAKGDERLLIISLTDTGRELKGKAVSVPEKLSCCIALDQTEAKELYRLLHKILAGFHKRDSLAPTQQA